MADSVKKTVCGILITIALAWAAWSSVSVINLYADAAVTKSQFATISQDVAEIKSDLKVLLKGQK